MLKILFAIVLWNVSAATPPEKRVSAEILEASQASDWREPDPNNTLYMELPSGRVVIELAPDFAPNHVANIKTLASEKYWNGLSIIRVQDNYVVQWGDPDAEKPSAKKMLTAKLTLPAEFDRTYDVKIPFNAFPESDVFAKEVGFSNGLAVARDKKNKKMWPLHCYGAVGAGRNNSPDSGGGAELYVVIGHAPRHLDRNVTLVGKVLSGIELLSSLPRGKGNLGFYQKPSEYTKIKSITLAADVPAKDRTNLEVLRTDTKLFSQLAQARKNRQEEWFAYKAGHLDVCAMNIPVRDKKTN